MSNAATASTERNAVGRFFGSYIPFSPRTNLGARSAVAPEELRGSRPATSSGASFVDNEVQPKLSWPSDSHMHSLLGSHASSAQALYALYLSIALESDMGVCVNPVDESPQINEVRKILRGFLDMNEGWDGPGSVPPRRGVIKDASEFLGFWPSDLDVPDPELGPDGTVALELYEDEGFSRGGFDFKGDGKATFTVLSRLKIIASGTFRADSIGEIVRSISKFKSALSSEMPNV